MPTLPTREEAEARYPHGTFARYKLARCSCFECRLAGSRRRQGYNARWLPPWQLKCVGRGRIYIVRNRHDGSIDSRHREKPPAVARVRQLNDGHALTVRATRFHVERLRAHGMGLRTIAEHARISPSTLRQLMNQPHPRPFRRTMERILAVGVELRGGAIVDAGATWELVACLEAAGWTQRRISEALGNCDRHLQIGRKRCHARTETRIRELHDSEWRLSGRLRELCGHIRV